MSLTVLVCLFLRTRRKEPGSPGDGPPPPPVSEADSWRSSLEHPLTAATSAMLNINEDPGGPNNPPPMTFSVYEYKSDKLGELWP